MPPKQSDALFGKFLWSVWSILLLLLLTASIGLLLAQQNDLAEMNQQLGLTSLPTGIPFGDSVPLPITKALMPVSVGDGSLRFTSITFGPPTTLDEVAGINELTVSFVTCTHFSVTGTGSMQVDTMRINEAISSTLSISGGQTTTMSGYEFPLQRVGGANSALSAQDSDPNNVLSWLTGKQHASLAMVGVEQIVADPGVFWTPGTSYAQAGTVSQWSAATGNNYQVSQGNVSVQSTAAGAAVIVLHEAGDWWLYFDVQCTVTDSVKQYTYYLSVPPNGLSTGQNPIEAYLYYNQGSSNTRPMVATHQMLYTGLPAGTQLALLGLCSASSQPPLNIPAWKMIAMKV